MSKVIMGNGVFTFAWGNLRVFQRGGSKQHKHVCSFSLVPCCWISLNKAKLLLPVMPIHIVAYWRFYTFVGQPLSKQLYVQDVQGGHRGSGSWYLVAAKSVEACSQNVAIWEFQPNWNPWEILQGGNYNEVAVQRVCFHFCHNIHYL